MCRLFTPLALIFATRSLLRPSSRTIFPFVAFFSPLPSIPRTLGVLAADATMIRTGAAETCRDMENFEVVQQIEYVGNHIAHTNKMRLTIQSDVVSFGTLYSQCAKCARKSPTVILCPKFNIIIILCPSTRVVLIPDPLFGVPRTLATLSPRPNHGQLQYCWGSAGNGVQLETGKGIVRATAKSEICQSQQFHLCLHQQTQ